MGKKESLATKRARERNYYQGCEWYCEFAYSDINGLGYEENVNRRDPSSIIKVNGKYYVWYTKSVGPHFGFGTGDPNVKVWPWDFAEIWYATSEDGINWEEQGRAVGRGEEGSYDDRTVCTPEILEHEGKYYLVYQAVKSPYLRRTKNTIGMAIADSPDGPWKKLDEPILRPSDTGEWLGEEDNRFLVKKKGDFDSHKVHDPFLLYFKGKFYLYYKGEIMGEEMYMGGRETKWGVAIADKPTGPYIKSEYNPVTNSGHETCLWKYKDGIAALLTTDGPERNTIQYAKDGINFEIKAYIKHAPEAPGPYRPENPDDDPLSGIQWGLCHVLGKWNYLRKFYIDNTLKNYFINRTPYE